MTVPSVGVKEGLSCVFPRAKWRGKATRKSTQLSPSLTPTLGTAAAMLPKQARGTFQKTYFKTFGTSGRPIQYKPWVYRQCILLRQWTTILGEFRIEKGILK